MDSVFLFLDITNNQIISIIDIIDSGSSLYATFIAVRLDVFRKEIRHFVLFDYNPLINLHHTYKFLLQRWIPACVLTNALKVELLLTWHRILKICAQRQETAKEYLFIYPFFFFYKALALLGTQFENPCSKTYWMPNKASV